MPALPTMLTHVAEIAPDNPLTDVISVKSAVLDGVREAGLLDRYVGGHPMAAPRSRAGPRAPAALHRRPWVVSVDDHVDPHVWSQVMHLALDCGSFVVPARSDEHDAAAAAISHLPHLTAEAMAIIASDVPLAFALAAGSFRDGTRVAATAPDLVRAMCETNGPELLPLLDRTIELLTETRRALADGGSVAELVEAGTPRAPAMTASRVPTRSGS